MIVMMRIRVEAGLKPAQTVSTAELSEDQGHQMIPTLERLVVGVPLAFVHNRLKPPPIDRFKKTPKDAIAIAHARPFLSLDNRKGSVCADTAEHAPRHSESFPGQPCRLRGEVGSRSDPGEGALP